MSTAPQAALDTPGARLDELCRAKAVQQAELIRAIGIDRSSLWKWRNAAELPQSVATFLRIADYFGVSLDWLACRPGAERGFDRATPSQDRQDLRAALGMLRDLHRLAVEECVFGNAVDAAAKMLDEFGMGGQVPAGRDAGRAT